MHPLKDRTRVEFEKDGISIDAGLIAEGFGLEPSIVQAQMREGTITSFCERGIDQDAGLYRLTFFHLNRRLRIVIDAVGEIRGRSLLNFGDHPLPASAHRPE